jgi:hypothetical protein
MTFNVLNSMYGIYTTNQWTALENVWNPQSLIFGSDYTQTVTYDPNAVNYNFSSLWKFPAAVNNLYTVHSYPSLIYGPSPWYGSGVVNGTSTLFPVQIGNIKSLTSNYNVTLGGNTSGYDVAFDLWVTNSPNGDSTSITNEIMVWIHRGGFNPAGQYLTAYSSKYFSGSIYYQPVTTDNSGGNSQIWKWKYAAVVANTDTLSGQIDFANILKVLVNNGIVSPTAYLRGVELGAEVAAGQGSLTINSLTVNLNGTGNTIFMKAQQNSLIGSLADENFALYGGIVPVVNINRASTFSEASNQNIGSSTNPIAVNGSGGIDTVYALGKSNQYTLTSATGGGWNLNENSGLNQNAVLTGITQVNFQDGSQIPLLVTLKGYSKGIIALTGSSSEYRITTNSNSLSIIDRQHVDLANTVLNISRIQFIDTMLALDTGANQTAGSGYMLYKAAFNRTPDAGGLGYWISKMDTGMGYSSVAQNFVNSSEFKAAFGGSNPTVNTLVTKLYNNVLNRTPDAGGLAFWQNKLSNEGWTIADVLGFFSTSGENVTNVTPLIANGIQYQQVGG